MVFLPSESSPIRKQLHILFKVFKLEGTSLPCPISCIKGCSLTWIDIMFGSLSKSELVKTLIDQICPLQNHPISLIQTLILPPGTPFISLSLSYFLFFSDISFYFPLYCMGESFSITKISVGFNAWLIWSLVSSSIKTIQVEETGLSSPFILWA